LNLQSSETNLLKKSLIVPEEEPTVVHSSREDSRRSVTLEKPGRASPKRTRAISDILRQRPPVIPRIKADSKSLHRYSNSQVFERNSVSRIEDGTSAIGPMRSRSRCETEMDSVIGFNQSQRTIRLNEQTTSLVEKQPLVHPKIQMLGQFRNKLKEDVSRYHGLKNLIPKKNILERDDISQKEVLEEMHKNKLRIQLVFGNKMFSKIKKENFKRVVDNKRKKDQILKPFLLQDGVHEYLEGIIQPSFSIVESSINQTARKERTVSKSPPPHTTNPQDDLNAKLPFLSLIKPWGLSEKKKVNRAKSTFLIRQRIFDKEVENEKDRALFKLSGKSSSRTDEKILKRI